MAKNKIKNLITGELRRRGFIPAGAGGAAAAGEGKTAAGAGEIWRGADFDFAEFFVLISPLDLSAAVKGAALDVEVDGGAVLLTITWAK